MEVSGVRLRDREKVSPELCLEDRERDCFRQRDLWQKRCTVPAISCVCLEYKTHDYNGCLAHQSICQLTLNSPGAGAPELPECISAGEGSDHSVLSRYEPPSVFWNSCTIYWTTQCWACTSHHQYSETVVQYTQSNHHKGVLKHCLKGIPKNQTLNCLTLPSKNYKFIFLLIKLSINKVHRN